MKIIKLKVMSNRIRDYAGIIQFAMVTVVFIQQTPFNLFWTVSD